MTPADINFDFDLLGVSSHGSKLPTPFVVLYAPPFFILMMNICIDFFRTEFLLLGISLLTEQWAALRSSIPAIEEAILQMKKRLR